MDLATFWDCHRRAFAHFGGVPGTIVYDRTKTVIRRHVARAGGAAGSGSGRVRRPLRLHHRRPRRLPADRERSGRTTGQHRPEPCNCRPQLRLDPRARRRLRRTGFRSADPRCIAPHGKVIAVRAQADWATLRGLPDQPLPRTLSSGVRPIAELGPMDAHSLRLSQQAWCRLTIRYQSVLDCCGR
jgi:hypothetical protein